MTADSRRLDLLRIEGAVLGGSGLIDNNSVGSACQAHKTACDARCKMFLDFRANHLGSGQVRVTQPAGPDGLGVLGQSVTEISNKKSFEREVDDAAKQCEQ